jgi:hypothetical protein
MLVALVIAFLVFCLLWWLVDYAAPPELQRPAKIILAVLALLWVLFNLLPALGVAIP